MDQKKNQTFWTLILCFAAALMEGADSQAMGIAAPLMKATHDYISPHVLGLAFSLGALGLLPGAIIAGRVADKIGRKPVTVISVAIFGIFSFVTAHAWNPGSLILFRFLTGVGLGACMPNLIALVSEIVPNEYRRTTVGAMYLTLPLGGALISAIGVVGIQGSDWRYVFYVGGIIPVILIPLMIAKLPESQRFLNVKQAGITDAHTSSFAEALFKNNRSFLTVSMWIGFFVTLSILFFLLNWLPTLLVGRGISKANAGMIQIVFNIAGAIGAIVCGYLMDKTRPWLVVTITFIGMIFGLFLLTREGSINSVYVAVGLAGLFLMGAQAIMYGLPAVYYPVQVRGTGAGAAVAAGRFGSFFGPYAAGAMLTAGLGSTSIIVASIPFTMIGLVFTLLVINRPTVDDA